MHSAPARAVRSACRALPVVLTLALSLLAGCASEPPRPATYTVKRGDTLYAIAWRLRLDYRELARWNGINDKYLIRPGQVLSLRPAGSRTAVVASRPQGTSRPQSTVPSRPPVRTTPVSPVPRATPVPAPVPAAPIAAVRWQWPVVSGTPTLTTRPNGGQGLTIAGEFGQPVLAAAGGRVVYTGTGLLGYGQLLIIKHNENYLTAYGHIDAVAVAEGDAVSAGQRVAAMGNGPQGTPLLYFEIRLNGTPGNPLLLLPQRS